MLSREFFLKSYLTLRSSELLLSPRSVFPMIRYTVTSADTRFGTAMWDSSPIGGITDTLAA
jgi:hypothetical protein